MSSKKTLIILGDGDHVREVVERLLLAQDFEKLALFSRSLSGAIQSLAERARALLDAEVFVAGGDDLVLRIREELYQRRTLDEMADFFFESTGGTISFGVGRGSDSAFVNLRRAKAQGGGAIVDRP